MKVLVTGGSGFIGSHLIETLIDEGYNVKILLRKTSSIRYIPIKKCDSVIGNLLEPESLKRAVADVDIVIHLAGSVIAPDEAHFLRANRDGTRNLLQAIENSGVPLQKFIYVSSQAAAGPAREGRAVTEQDEPLPVSAYGRSKLAAEQEVLAFADKVPSVILRPSIVYGPRDKGTLNIIRMIRNHIRGKIGFGKMWMSMIHVKDLVNLILLCLEAQVESGEIFFATDNRDGYPHNEIYDLMQAALGTRAIPLTIPKSVLKLSAVCSEAFSLVTKKPTFLNLDKYREISQRDWRCSSEKARKLLKFRADIRLEEGLTSTIRWYKENDWL